jgi:hypothetical protein
MKSNAQKGYILLGFRVLGTLSNMLVSMFAWMAQFDDVSFLAVTSTEYRCATDTLSISTGCGCVSVCGNMSLPSCKKQVELNAHRQLR